MTDFKGFLSSAADFGMTLCWNISSSADVSLMFDSTNGASADPTAAKCSCLAGMYYDTDTAACTACGAFDYSNGMVDVCVTCPNEQYLSSVGSTSCIASCPAGKYGSATTGACTECDAGLYSSSAGRTSECSDKCPAGRYSLAGASGCTLCAAGTYTTLTASTVCTDCLAGRYSASLGLTAECPNLCSSGQYSLSAASTCMECQQGSYQDKTGQSECLNCAGGTFSNATGVATSCPGTCESGYYSSSGATKCTACATDTYSNAGASACAARVACNASAEASGDCVKPINGTRAFRTAIAAWCEDETAATITYGHISNWDTSRVTDMSNAFYLYCETQATINVDISAWDTSAVTGSRMLCLRGSGSSFFVLIAPLHFHLHCWQTCSTFSTSLLPWRPTSPAGTCPV